MLFLSFLRYIQGYAEFEASGGFPERFINLCTKNRIPLWNIKNTSGTITAATTENALKEVERTAGKAGMDLSVRRVVSLKSSLEKHKKRKGLLFSLLFCVLVTVFLSFFIWSVSVEGNEQYSKEEILHIFEENGVKIGSFKSSIDTVSVSEKAVSALDKLSWAKVNIRGCFAVIEVRELKDKPDIFDESKPVNIVSDSDGVIIKYEVSKGTPLLKPSLAVTKGDLLVSGVLTNSDGSERLVHSKSFITARVETTVKGDFNSKLFSLNGENTRYSVFFFGLTLPDYKNKDALFESREYLDNKNRLLPLGIFRYSGYLFEDEHTPDESEKALLNAFDFNGKAIKIYSESENVIKANISVPKDILTGKFVCEKQIGVEKEILTE